MWKHISTTAGQTQHDERTVPTGRCNWRAVHHMRRFILLFLFLTIADRLLILGRLLPLEFEDLEETVRTCRSTVAAEGRRMLSKAAGDR